MITLIAESKTMLTRGREILPETFAAHMPDGEDVADEIICALRNVPAENLAEVVGISASLAGKCRGMIYGFPDKSTGLSALESFTGIVFRHLMPDSMSEADVEYAERNLRIVSSLYGLLRPSDIIKPYRLDYCAKAAPGGLPLLTFWRERCTQDLLRLLRTNGETEVLDLMPADASRMFDWKMVREKADVSSVAFQETVEGGKLRTPRAGRLKELRGKLLRTVIATKTECFEELKGLEHKDFVYDSESSSFGRLFFFC